MTDTTEGAALDIADVTTAESAVAALLDMGLEDEPADADATPETPGEGEGEPAPPPDEAGQQPEAEAEGAPEGEPDDGEGSDDFTPPESWNADEKAIFATLTPEAQEVIARRDAEREQAFKNSKASLDAQKAAHTEAEAEATRQFHERFALLDTIFEKMEAAFFDGLAPGTEEDLDKDPDEYMRKNARFQTRQAKWDALKKDIAEARRKAAEDTQAQLRTASQTEWEARVELWPEWGDPAKQQGLTNAVNAYLQDKGFRPDELKGLVDHRLFAVLKDALSHVKVSEARKNVRPRVATKPKVQKPGTKNTQRSTSRERDSQARERMRKSGKREDAEAWVEGFVL